MVIPALFAGDLLALQLALFFGWLGRSALNPWLNPPLAEGQYRSLALGLCILPLVYGFVGLYPGYGMSPVERLRRRVYTVTLLFVLVILWQYLVVKGHASRGVLLLTWSLSLVLGPIMETAVRRCLMMLRAWGTPVVVLGSGETGRAVTHALTHETNLGLIPIGLFDDNADQWGQRIEGVPVMGPLSQAKLAGGEARIAMVALPHMENADLAMFCARLPFPKILFIPNLTGFASLHVVPRDIGGLIGLEIHQNLIERRNWLFKRILDYALGIPMLLATLPLLGLFAAWIKIISPRGGMFYCQQRVGLGGRSFRLWKLRTMHPDADARLAETLKNDHEARDQWARNCKIKNDPRLLPGVGKILRRTSLDELPQLWNVLRGEMSLVGPRPFPHYHLENFHGRFRTLRRRVLPGMTGLWQVSSRSEGDLNAQELLDTYYIRNWSLWLDIYVLSRTFAAVITGRGAY